MRVHIIAEGKVLGEGNSNYIYIYTCKKADENNMTPEIGRGFLFGNEYPHSYYFDFLNDVDIDEDATDTYLTALAEHLNHHYQKAMPDSNLHSLSKLAKAIYEIKENVFDTINDSIKTSLTSKSLSM